jgi:P-type Ca2+ transporter type 2C
MKGEAYRPALAAMTEAELYAALQSRTQRLTRLEAMERLRSLGSNRIEKIRGRPVVFKFLANFTHIMAVLLWLGGMVAFLAELPQLALAIWTAILINGLFSFWQEYKTERAMEALQRLLPVHARVLRDGREVRIDAGELVPGDILLLAPSDPISADGRLLEVQQLHTDESNLTASTCTSRSPRDSEPSAAIRARVEAARHIRKFCPPDAAC